MTIKITIIGGGVIGLSTAWKIARLKLDINIQLVDPNISQRVNTNTTLNGTNASLGVLMGNIFRKSEGRGWELRQQSMKLWKHWIKELNTPKTPLEIKTPLIQLATSEKEATFMKEMVIQRSNLGVSLFNTSNHPITSLLCGKDSFGGILSENDGRIDPIQLSKALLHRCIQNHVQIINSKVVSLQRLESNTKWNWKIKLINGETSVQHIVVICGSTGTSSLLTQLGYSISILPILGQALILKVDKNELDLDQWPSAVMSYQGFNLIPIQENKLVIGATLEPGINPNRLELEKMKMLNGDAPQWIKNAEIVDQWHGIRGRPEGRGAPIMEILEKGLIVSSGHYRNGILLAPASAEWVTNAIKKEISKG